MSDLAAANPTETSTPVEERPAQPASMPWPSADQLRSFAAWFGAWIARPRVRLAVIGGTLLLSGGLIVTSSVWTLPLVIGGAAMVLIAWLGSRLDGHFAVEWGESGTQLQFRAQIRSAEHVAPVGAPLPAAEHRGVDERPAEHRGLDGRQAGHPEPGGEPNDAEVVEGEAHTVEIDVAELKALIAVAEAKEVDQRELATVASIRVPAAVR